MMTLEQLLDEAFIAASDTLVGEPGAALMPTFLVQLKNQPPVIMGAPWSNEDEKLMSLAAMRLLLKQTVVHSYSFVSEAWLSTEDPRHPTGLTPSEREDKREALIVTACDRRHGELRTYGIERGPDGTVTNLVRDTRNQYFGGRLHNLFRDP